MKYDLVKLYGCHGSTKGKMYFIIEVYTQKFCLHPPFNFDQFMICLPPLNSAI